MHRRILPFTCSLLLALLPLGPAQAQTQPLPSGLPSHFGVGVSAHPDNSGIYRENVTYPNFARWDSAFLSIPDTLAPGSYAFKTGVFAPDWSSMYVWNDQAGTLTISN